ncbi:hypothetical protein O6H91_02G055800 [Diphasiastrum complanatum]|uniref:Uncharacterized protein n=1 Tax=Diphasiastrum complanatum TaxID=34168 RepID=A0ACC2EG00_DIPCM|nr:hypothetical protein O6H91_02G055800 [Diphasiastrum complanatum]
MLVDSQIWDRSSLAFWHLCRLFVLWQIWLTRNLQREESDANKDPFREQSNEVGFTCAICLDTMKEATSTVCGHIFCRCCISEVIKACKSCPTCRKKLNSSLIHRVYIENMI